MLWLSVEDKIKLTRAAILHDWYKREEITRMNFDTTGSEEGLREEGIEQEVIDIAHSVGHTSLTWIEGSTLLRKLLHFIDDIVANTEIVSIKERVEFVRKSGTRDQLAEDFRSQLGGRSFFDVQVEVGERIQYEIEDICGIEHGTLITVIRHKYEQDKRLQTTS